MMVIEFEGRWQQDLSPWLAESYPAVPDSPSRARRAIARFAAAGGATDAEIDAVRLAVSEAVTNAVQHAYRETAGQIHLSATVIDGELWVLIADDGCGHQAPPPSPGLGLGIALMASVSRELVLTERADGGTEVRLRFPLGQDTAASSS